MAIVKIVRNLSIFQFWITYVSLWIDKQRPWVPGTERRSGLPRRVLPRTPSGQRGDGSQPAQQHPARQSLHPKRTSSVLPQRPDTSPRACDGSARGRATTSQQLHSPAALRLLALSLAETHVSKLIEETDASIRSITHTQSSQCAARDSASMVMTREPREALDARSAAVTQQAMDVASVWPYPPTAPEDNAEGSVPRSIQLRIKRMQALERMSIEEEERFGWSCGHEKIMSIWAQH
eukprot:m.828597 g.828597  ORF g.828597 m.828597 type:complete len:236 (-) comp23419_c1_seq65:1853-2560(-)